MRRAGEERATRHYVGQPDPGNTFDQQWVQFLTLRDGKVARFRQFPDTAAVGAAFAS